MQELLARPDGLPSVIVLRPGVYSPIVIPPNATTRSGVLLIMSEHQYRSCIEVENSENRLGSVPITIATSSSVPPCVRGHPTRTYEQQPQPRHSNADRDMSSYSPSPVEASGDEFSHDMISPASSTLVNLSLSVCVYVRALISYLCFLVSSCA